MGHIFVGRPLCCSERNSYATFTKQVLMVLFFFLLKSVSDAMAVRLWCELFITPKKPACAEEQ